MSIVLNTAPSQARQAAAATDPAPVRPAAGQGTDTSTQAQAGIKSSGGGEQIAHPAKKAAGNDDQARTDVKAAPVAAPSTTTAAAQATAAAGSAADTAPPLFAQLLGQAAQTGPVAVKAGAADADGKGDDKTDDKANTTTTATDALLQAMAAPLMTQPATPAAPAGTASSGDGAQSAATAAVGATEAAAQAPGSLASLLTVINPAAALNAQAMNAQAAIADAQALAAQSATPSAKAADKAAAADASASTAGQAYSNIVAQLLGSRAPAPAGTPLAAAAPATNSSDAAAAPAAALPASAPAAAAPAVHAAVDSDGTTTAAVATDPTAVSGFGVAAPSGNAGSGAPGTLTLSGPAQQWQQPLQQALGDRLQMQLSNNSQQAVIRLEPPNLGSIEIAIRHADGALQVNLSASNSDVLRQLHTIGDSVRQDLSARQYTDVAVTVSATPRSAGAQNFADGGGDNRQRQPGQDGDENAPGRALSDSEQPYGTTFALNDRE